MVLIFLVSVQTVLKVTKIQLIYRDVIRQSDNLINIESSIVRRLKLIILILMNLRQRRVLQIVLWQRCLFRIFSNNSRTILVVVHKTLHDHLRLPMLLQISLTNDVSLVDPKNFHLHIRINLVIILFYRWELCIIIGLRGS